MALKYGRLFDVAHKVSKGLYLKFIFLKTQENDFGIRGPNIERKSVKKLIPGRQVAVNIYTRGHPQTT